MRKLVFVIFVLLSNTEIVFSQLPFFDSSYVIVSSPNHDFKNPVYMHNRGIAFPIYNKDYLLYEKKNGNTSNIVVRKFNYNGYDPEVMVTNDTGIQNINPSIAGDLYNGFIIMWQSNKNGNWDIFYSFMDTSGIVSSPIPLTNTPSEERNPTTSGAYLHNSIFAFEENNDIKVIRFRLADSSFYGDTNITTHLNDSCRKPIIMGGSVGAISYEVHNGNSIRLHSRRYWNADTAIVWQTEWINSQPGNQLNYTYSYAGSDYLSYSYDTLGGRNVLFARPDYSNFYLMTNEQGNSFNGKSMLFPIITDGGIPFEVFSYLNIMNDSLSVKVRNGNFNPDQRKFYLGNSSTRSKSNVSYPIFHLNFYKIRVVWEQVINGRMALVESYTINFLNNLTNISNNAPVTFSLHQNYPNPFNPETKIKFEIPLSVRGEKAEVRLSVYDVSGKEVRVLVNSELSPGVYEYSFDGTGLGSGVYFYKLQSGNFVETRRMVLVK